MAPTSLRIWKFLLENLGYKKRIICVGALSHINLQFNFTLSQITTQGLQDCLTFVWFGLLVAKTSQKTSFAKVIIYCYGWRVYT